MNEELLFYKLNINIFVQYFVRNRHTDATVHICIHTCRHTYTNTHARMHTHTHMGIRTCTHARTHTHTHTPVLVREEALLDGDNTVPVGSLKRSDELAPILPSCSDDSFDGPPTPVLDCNMLVAVNAFCA